MSKARLPLGFAILLLGCIFTPLTSASPTLLEKIAMIKDFSSLGTLDGVDVAKNGTILVNVGFSIYRSVDYGVSWQKTFEAVNATGEVGQLSQYVKSGTAFTMATYGHWGSQYSDLYRSTDDGQSWTKVADDLCPLWRMDELSNGTLLVSTYSTANPPSGFDYIYKSDDDGQTWTIWQNLTSCLSDIVGMSHLHAVRVNPFNDDIWVLGGDDVGGLGVWRWNTDSGTWATLYNVTGGRYCFDDIIFDDTHCYITPDHDENTICRLPHRAVSWSEKAVVFDLATDDSSSQTGDTSSRTGFSQKGDDLLLIGTERGTVIASSDGERWLKVFQTDEPNRSHLTLTCFSRRRDGNGYIYFINRGSGKLYRTDISADDVRRVFRDKYNSYLGSTENGIFRMSVQNQARIDFDSSCICCPSSRFRISVGGLDSGNLLGNPSFETGNLDGWRVGGQGSFAVTASARLFGEYGLEVNKTSVDAQSFYIEWASPFNQWTYSEYWSASAYVKANRTVYGGVRIEIGYYANGSWRALTRSSAVVRSSFAKISGITTRSKIGHRLYVRYCFGQSSLNTSYCIDAMSFQRDVGNGVVVKENNGDTIVYRTPVSFGNTNGSYSDPLEHSENISLYVSGYSNAVWSGSLLEDAKVHFDYEVASTEFEIHITVGGSQQLLLEITGLPLLTLPTGSIWSEPRTLNLKSRGRWITTHIELPKGYDVRDINASTIMLNEAIQAEPRPIAVGDYDSDAVPDLTVRFARSEVVSYILENVELDQSLKIGALNLTGKFYDGTLFNGNVTFRIIYARALRSSHLYFLAEY